MKILKEQAETYSELEQALFDGKIVERSYGTQEQYERVLEINRAFSPGRFRILERPEHPHLGGFQLLPPKPDVCQVCAQSHKPELPHNQQSLFYQYNFYGENGRWPTWKDAMEHCTDEMKQFWVTELAKKGVTV